MAAGMADAGLSALGSFVAGLYAVRVLDLQTLGIYALFVTSFSFAAIVPMQLVFVPSEVQILRLPVRQRISGYRLTARVGVPVAGLAAGLCLLALPFASQGGDVVAPIAITATGVAFLSPIQDHIRRLAHMAERSWLAAGVSLAQVGTVSVVLGAGTVFDVGAAWLPFGSLLAANGASIAIGLLAARAVGDTHPLVAVRFRDLARSGGWLVLVGLLPALAMFVVSAIFVLLAGAEELGLVEAARIAARPLIVLITGVAAVIGPKSMAAAQRQDYAEGRRLNRLAELVAGAVSIVVVLLLGFDWVGNPMAEMNPEPYRLAWLVPLTLAGHVVGGLQVSHYAQLIGAGRVIELAAVQSVAAVLQIASVFTAGLFGVHTIPLGFLISAMIRFVGFRAALKRSYRSPTTARA